MKPVRKSFTFLLFTILVFINPSGSFVQAQTTGQAGKIYDKDDGSVHALGNGKMLVYKHGPDIIKIYPAPYSTPSLFKLDMTRNTQTETRSIREQGTAIWTHQVFQNGKSAGMFTDFVDSELPCMIRHFNLTETISFRLVLEDFVKVITKPGIAGSKGNLLLFVPAGTTIYQKYTYPKPLYHQIMWKGNVKVEQKSDQENEYIITFNPGESDIYFSGGPEYPEVISNSEEAQKSGYAKLLDRTRTWWEAFTAERTDFGHQFPANLPLREKLLQTIDDVSVMIRTQQALEGSVMAGYPYPLGYVRDQYGVSRGLLALGYFKEAKNILSFYWNIWKKYGEIHNAQGIGIEGVFHVHENDEVETPGYLIIQAFDLLEKSGDDAFIAEIFPLLEWCWDVQKKNLVRGMLPFNGDETYVAGGFLPRSALNDGSAEATILFIDGGEKLLTWIKKHEKWTSVKIENERMVLENTRKLFRENFWKNGQLITNNPERVNLTDIPRFRHGVCEQSGPDCLVFGRKGFAGIDWTERDINNRYQCPACLALGPLPKIAPQIYNLISVSLTPLYTHSSQFEPKELKPIVAKVFGQYKKTGDLTCIIDSTSTKNNKLTVGYDYGFLLYSMLETKMEGAETIYKKTLSVADSTGVWSEYYNDHRPQGTRYRPWESAINIEALIKFANQYDISARQR
ncbi:MAG: hypothetical protein M0R39_11265 [Prolixibacteraceae bacterium]|nr:hypothetical protein [Prolixibacteraceae bacterium]